MVLAIVSCRDKEKKAAAPLPAATSTIPVDPNELNIGSTMPAYSGPTLDGATFDLAKEKGNVVFLNLWATWCGPCRLEIPELEQIHEKYQSRGFKVVGVSVDESGPEAVKAFTDEYKVTYPIVLDPTGKLAVLLRTSILPTSVIVDRQGKIVWRKYGPILPNDRALVVALETALGKVSS